MKRKKSDFASPLTRGPLSIATLVLISIIGATGVTIFAPLRADNTVLIPMELPDVSVGPDGSAAISKKLEFPAATHGMRPDLALVHAGGGAGLLGNWDIEGLSSIQLDRLHGSHADNNGTHFTSLPGGRMIAVTPGEFRNENDQNTIYRSNGNCGQGPCTFTAILPDGTKMFYGFSSDSALSSTAPYETSIHTWALNKVQDLQGNYYTIEYFQSGGKLYPETISYTKNDAVSGLAERTIEFEYDSVSNPEIQYNGGQRQDADRIVKRINSTQSGNSIFRYDFEYTFEPVTNRPRLAAYHEFIEGQKVRTSLRFHHSEASQSHTPIDIPGVQTGLGAPDLNTCALGAFSCQVALSDPANQFAVGLCIIYAVSGAKLRCEVGNTRNSGDMNGDGLEDMTSAVGIFGPFANLISVDVQSSVYLDPGGNGGGFQSFAPYADVGSQVYFDMNGDGRDDFVRTVTHLGFPTTFSYMVSINNGSGFAAPYEITPPHGMGLGFDENLFVKMITEFLIDLALNKLQILREKKANQFERKRNINGVLSGGLSFVSSGTVEMALANIDNKLAALNIAGQIMESKPDRDAFGQMADMNGDGKIDYVRLINGSTIATAFTNGTGFTSDVQSQVTIGAAGTMRQLGDFNGDGVPDFYRIIEASGARIMVTLGHDDGTFSGDFVSAPLDVGYSHYRLIRDINGDGYGDFVRLTGGAAPNTLTITYGTGTGFGHTVSRIDVGHDINRNFVDINGDGNLDFVRAVNIGPAIFPIPFFPPGDEAQYALKVTLFSGDGFNGAEFNLPVFIPNVTALRTIRLFYGDTNGDGRPEVIVPEDGVLHTHVQPAERAGLLTSIDNEAGKNVSITYRNAHQLGLVNTSRNQAFGDHSVRADNSPRYLVTEVAISGNSGLKAKTTYEYAGGLNKIGPNRFESQRLGFDKITTRGFACASAGCQAMPTYSEQIFLTFHPVLGYKGAGLLDRSEIRRTSNNSLVSRQSATFGTPPGYPFTGIRHIVQTGTRKEDYSTNRTIVTEQSVQQFDPFGNPTLVRDFGDTSSPGDDKITELTYEFTAQVPAGRVIRQRVTDPSGASVRFMSYQYDANGNVNQTSEGISQSATIATTMQHDAVGNVTVSTKLGLASQHQYDSDTSSLAVSMQTPEGVSVVREFNTARGLLLSETDPDGRKITNSYDLLGRKKRTEVSGPSLFSGAVLETISYDYQPDGSMIMTSDRSVTDTQRVVDSTHMDEWGRTLFVRSQAAGGTVEMASEYDIFDRLIKKDIPHFVGNAGGFVTTNYDDLGRVIRTEQPGPAGNVIITQDPQTVFEASFTSIAGVSHTGYATAQTRPNGQTLFEYKTLSGLVIQSEYSTDFSPAPSSNARQRGFTRVRYHYDPAGQIVAITRGTGITQSGIPDDATLTMNISYDLFGRRIATFDPDKGVINFTYNALHLPECTTFANQKSVCKTYDAMGRLKEMRMDSVNGAILATYNMDEAASENGSGRLTSIQDASGTRRLHYDGITGNVSRVERSYLALNVAKQFDISYKYSPAGFLTEKSFSAVNLKLAYDYNPEGSLRETRLIDPDHHILKDGSTLSLLSTSLPDALGNVATVTYPNGVQIQNTYDSIAGHLKRYTANSPAAGSIADTSLTYNPEGLILEKKDNRLAALDTTEQFSYDIARRLISASGPYGDADVPTVTQDFAYGPDGQLFQMGQNTATYTETHRLASLGSLDYTYDAQTGPGRGNVSARTTTASRGRPAGRPNPRGNPPPGVQPGPGTITQNIVYNHYNRIESVESNGPMGWIRASYVYDDSGERFQKKLTQGGVTETTYLSDDYKIVSDNNNEIHTLELRNGTTLVARYSFAQAFHTAMLEAPANLYQERMLAYGNGIVTLSGGPVNLPILFQGFVKNAYESMRALPETSFYLWWILFIFSCASVIFMILRMWRTEALYRKRQSFALMPVWAVRASALILIVSFYAMNVSCAKNGNGDRDGIFAIPTDGALDNGLPVIESSGGILPLAGGSAPDCSSKQNPGRDYASGMLGTYYYISSSNGSNEVVTDTCGKVVQRYVFEPYGQLNRLLTDYDPDGDNVQYLQPFQYTGQEYDAETGLYNYHARLYDPGTGRFLQPDPVHTAMAGMDSFDRYEYVAGNPVNFRDPDGRSVEGFIAAFWYMLPFAYVGVELSQGNPPGYNFAGSGASHVLDDTHREILDEALEGTLDYPTLSDLSNSEFLKYALVAGRQPKGHAMDRAGYHHDRDVADKARVKKQTPFFGKNCHSESCRSQLISANKDFINRIKLNELTGFRDYAIAFWSGIGFTFDNIRMEMERFHLDFKRGQYGMIREHGSTENFLADAKNRLGAKVGGRVVRQFSTGNGQVDVQQAVKEVVEQIGAEYVNMVVSKYLQKEFGVNKRKHRPVRF